MHYEPFVNWKLDMLNFISQLCTLLTLIATLGFHKDSAEGGLGELREMILPIFLISCQVTSHLVSSQRTSQPCCPSPPLPRPSPSRPTPTQLRQVIPAVAGGAVVGSFMCDIYIERRRAQRRIKEAPGVLRDEPPAMVRSSSRATDHFTNLRHRSRRRSNWSTAYAEEGSQTLRKSWHRCSIETSGPS